MSKRTKTAVPKIVAAVREAEANANANAAPPKPNRAQRRAAAAAAKKTAAAASDDYNYAKGGRVVLTVSRTRGLVFPDGTSIGVGGDILHEMITGIIDLSKENERQAYIRGYTAGTEKALQSSLPKAL